MMYADYSTELARFEKILRDKGYNAPSVTFEISTSEYKDCRIMIAFDKAWKDENECNRHYAIYRSMGPTECFTQARDFIANLPTAADARTAQRLARLRELADEITTDENIAGDFAASLLSAIEGCANNLLPERKKE